MCVPHDQTLPLLWLLSDQRNDARLEAALAGLPRRSGFVFRHYHLADALRRKRFDALAALARARDHLVVLSGDAELAAEWGADGVYGPPALLEKRTGLLRLATAHDAGEVAAANRCRADAVLISPVFATASHPDAKPLDPLRFRELAAQAQMPVIALGGMNVERARDLDWPRWAAIDGFS